MAGNPIHVTGDGGRLDFKLGSALVNGQTISAGSLYMDLGIPGPFTASPDNLQTSSGSSAVEVIAEANERYTRQVKTPQVLAGVLVDDHNRFHWKSAAPIGSKS